MLPTTPVYGSGNPAANLVKSRLYSRETRAVSA